MDPIRTALWFVEGNISDPIGLEDIAQVSELSRFHFSRTFANATGLPVSSYLRRRRLTEAARALAEGAPNILTVALEAGYGSHEAFTRAFRTRFGSTPQAVRAGAPLDKTLLTEPYRMQNQPKISLADPEIRAAGPFRLAGLRQFRTFDERATIPAQWQRFGPFMGQSLGQVGGDAFGVCLAPSPGEEGFDYFTAVEVRSLDDLPEGLSGMRLDRRDFAVFKHEGHISSIGSTCTAIFADWAPGAGVRLEQQPVFLIERYGANFDPRTGLGDMEVWIPLEP